MLRVADLAESYGGEIRLTRRAELHPHRHPGWREWTRWSRAVERLGFPLAWKGLRGASIACTGDPFCNFTVAETKGKLKEIVEHLEAGFGDEVAGLRLNLDGCPHACAHHWIGDIGLQGTTAARARARRRAARRLRHLPARRPWRRTRPSAGRSSGGCRRTEVHLVIERLVPRLARGRDARRERFRSSSPAKPTRS